VRAKGDAGRGGRFRPRIVEILAERTRRRPGWLLILFVVFDRSTAAGLRLPYLVQAD
jgi:hypothetical protein